MVKEASELTEVVLLRGPVVLAMGAVVTVLLGLEVPLKLDVTVLLGLEVPLKSDGTCVARVGSDSSESEELPQAETNKSRATPAISFPLLIRLNSLCTNCHYIPSLKAVQQMSNNNCGNNCATE